MKKKSFILIVVLMISTLSYSKTIYRNDKYPIKTIIGSDTVVVISTDQVKKINKDIFLLETLQKKDSIWSINYTEKEKVILDLQKNIKELQELISINDTIIRKQESSILMYKEKHNLITKSYEKENLMLRKEVKRSTIKIAVFSVAILLGLLISK